MMAADRTNLSRLLGRGVAALPELATLRTPLLILSIELVLSSAFILYFCRSFRISYILLFIHLPLVLGLFGGSMLAAGFLLFLGPIRKSRLARHLIGVVPGIAFSLVGLLYAIDYSNYFWNGYNINYPLLQLYIYTWRRGGDLISLSRSVYAGVTAFVFVIVAVHVLFGEQLARAMETLLRPSRPFSLFKDRRRALKSAIAIVLIFSAYTLAVGVMVTRAKYSELLSSDPFLSFVRSTTTIHDPSYDAYAAHIRLKDQNCRSTYPRGQTFDKKNVIVITVDALRPDHTQVYGYERPTTPFLNQLAETGRLRRVEFATAACSGTFCGVMSTMTSKNVKQLVSENFKVYDLLHDQGYRTYLILSGSHSIQGLKEAYGREMDLYFDGENSKKYEPQDDRVIFEGLDLVPDYRDSPAFFYIHVMAVHLIGVKQDSFNRYQPTAERRDFRAMFRGEPTNWTAIINSYDNSVMQADATIKEIFEALDKKGYLRNSVVVILSDHGEGLGERTKYGWGHGHWLYREFIQIPMLIYDDSPVEYKNLKVATQLDVAPTIVDRLGLSVPPCWQGTSLLNPGVRTVTTQQTGLSRPCYAVLYRTGVTTYQYLYCSVGKTEELYDLTNDPREQRNLIGTADASLLGRLREELRRMQSD